MNEKPSSYRYVIEVILFLTYALFGVSWLAISPLAKELFGVFQVSKTEFALLFTVVTIAKVIAPIVTGAVALRLGLKWTILAGSAFICVVLLGPLVPTFQVFLLSRFLFGLGEWKKAHRLLIYYQPLADLVWQLVRNAHDPLPI